MSPIGQHIMKLIALRSWRRLRPGDQFERTDGVANVLIRRGIAKVYEAPQPPKKHGKARRNNSIN